MHSHGKWIKKSVNQLRIEYAAEKGNRGMRILRFRVLTSNPSLISSLTWPLLNLIWWSNSQMMILILCILCHWQYRPDDIDRGIIMLRNDPQLLTAWQISKSLSHHIAIWVMVTFNFKKRVTAKKRKVGQVRNDAYISCCDLLHVLFQLQFIIHDFIDIITINI